MSKYWNLGSSSMASVPLLANGGLPFGEEEDGHDTVVFNAQVSPSPLPASSSSKVAVAASKSNQRSKRSGGFGKKAGRHQQRLRISPALATSFLVDIGKRIPAWTVLEIRRERDAMASSTLIKVYVLVWLVLQNSVHALLLRYSRVRDVPEMYFSTVAVFWTEVIKIFACLLMIVHERRSFLSAFRLVKKQVLDQPSDTIKVCLPAMLYTLQNNLFYTAANHLNAATFMIVSQLKIFSAAIFSIILLNRSLVKTQWFSLITLFIGVCFVQLQSAGGDRAVKGTANQHVMTGFMAACVACGISGFAGVFFEKILKGSEPVSLWMRNVQMSMFAIPASLLAAVVQDGSRIEAHGFMYGFDAVVWATVCWYCIGGLSVAICIKYADNIAKNFATSVAIILATLGSIQFFGFQPSFLFTFGAGLVILSIFLYSSSSIFVRCFGTFASSHSGGSSSGSCSADRVPLVTGSPKA